MKLSPMRAGGQTKIKRCDGFGGCNYSQSCKENEFVFMSNFSARRFPALCQRQIKYTLNRTCSDFYIYNDAIYYVSSGSLYKDNKAILTLAAITANKRYFSVVGNLLIIMPDKQYYDIKKKTYGSLEASVTTACSFDNGTRFGVACDNNCIKVTGVDLTENFREGDAITVSGSGQNDGTYIIRELYQDKMMFDENVFTFEETSDPITISRTVPALKFTFECNNRLWGIYNNAIYASALGDPFNFNKFDGISTDSYYKEVFSSGEFTGAVSYGNTPVFFKETMIYRLFGDTPDSFYLEIREAPGVSYGCDMTIAKVNGMLMYAGYDGIYGYDSSYPVKLSEKLGNFRTGRGCAGSDGTIYYVSISDFKGVYSGITALLKALDARRTYAYNSATKTWHRFDDDTVINRIECGNYGSSQDKPNVFALDDNGKIFTLSDEIAGSSSVSYYVKDHEKVIGEGITGDWTFGGQARLKYSLLTLSLSPSSTFEMSISLDGGDFIPVASVTTDQASIEKRRLTFNVPRTMFSSMRLKFNTSGDFTLHSIEFHYENTGRAEK